MASKNSVGTGDIAPDFELIDQDGKVHHLSNYRGRWIVLYFYPKNNTPGCTEEACKFRDDYFKLNKLGVEVLGVSVDNQKSHAAFSRKHGLPFPLLSDTDGKIASQYGSFFSFGPLRFARRHTFIIDKKGRIGKVYRSVDTRTHSETILRDIKVLQKVKP